MTTIKTPPWMRSVFEAKDHRGKLLLTNGWFAFFTEEPAPESAKDVSSTTATWVPDVDLPSTIVALLNTIGVVCETCKDSGARTACPDCHAGTRECMCSDCGNHHDTDCDSCDGSGSLGCSECQRADKTKPKRIGRSPFDTRLVKLIVTELGTVTRAAFSHQGDHRMLMLWAGDRCATLMQMRDDIACSDLGVP